MESGGGTLILSDIGIASTYSGGTVIDRDCTLQPSGGKCAGLRSGL